MREGQSPCGRYGRCPPDGCWARDCWVDADPEEVEAYERERVRAGRNRLEPLNPDTERLFEVDEDDAPQDHPF